MMLNEFEHITTDDALVNLNDILAQYLNKYTDRIRLKEDCTELNRLDLYEEIMKVWGDKPTIEDPNAPKTLDQLKQEKLDELESRFTERVKSSFITDEGYKMQFNTDDSLKMFGAIQLFENQGLDSGYITDADDITHYEVSVSVMKSVQNQMLNKYAECHLLKQQYRALIEAASDEEALQDIEFEF